MRLDFGAWLASVIRNQTQAKVMKVTQHYYDVDALAATATTIDSVMRSAILEERKMSPLESFAIDVLIDVAGFKDRTNARYHYQKYCEATTS